MRRLHPVRALVVVVCLVAVLSTHIGCSFVFSNSVSVRKSVKRNQCPTSLPIWGDLAFTSGTIAGAAIRGEVDGKFVGLLAASVVYSISMTYGIMAYYDLTPGQSGRTECKIVRTRP